MNRPSFARLFSALPFAASSREARPSAAARLRAAKRERRSHFWKTARKEKSWRDGVNLLKLAGLCGAIALALAVLSGADSPFSHGGAVVLGFGAVSFLAALAEFACAWDKIRRWRRKSGTGMSWSSGEAVSWRAIDRAIAESEERLAQARDIERAAAHGSRIARAERLRRAQTSLASDGESAASSPSTRARGEAVDPPFRSARRL